MKGKGIIKALLTVASIVSFGKVIYDAGKAAIAAKPDIDNIKETNYDHKLHKEDYIYIGKKYYKDVAIDTAVNVGSTITLGIVNHCEIKALTATATAAVGAYTKYRNDLKSLYGSGVDQKVLHKDKIFEAREKSGENLIIEKRNKDKLYSDFDIADIGDQYLFYCSIATDKNGVFNDSPCTSGTWFRASIPEVLEAEIEMRKLMDIYGDATLHDYYAILGVNEHTNEEADYAKCHEWSSGAICEAFDYLFMNFRYEKKVRDDGIPYYEISTVEPLLPVGNSDIYPTIIREGITYTVADGILKPETNISGL